MVDVLRSKNGFKALITHCVSEMNVEGILFLVEVSQYKEKLKRTGDCGENRITAHNLNVFTTNLHSVLLEARCMHDEEQALQFARSVSASRHSYMRRRESAMVWGFNSSRAQKDFETQTQTPHSDSGNAADAKLTPEHASALTKRSSHTSVLATPIHLKTGNNNESPSLGPRHSSLRLTTMQEDTFKMFQEDILGRNWLPINNKMKPLSSPTPSCATPGPDLDEIEEIHLDAVSEQREEVVTPPPAPGNYSPQLSQPSPQSSNQHTLRFSQLRSLREEKETQTRTSTTTMNNESVTSYSPGQTGQAGHGPRARMFSLKRNASAPSPVLPHLELATKKPTLSTPSPPMTGGVFPPMMSTKSHPALSPSPIKIFKLTATASSPSSPSSPSTTPRELDNTDDIYDQARYLFNKYVHTDSELVINISHETRQGLMRLFSSDTNDAFNLMYDSFFAELSDEEQISIADDARYRISFLKTYLYHCFDIAFHDIWSLVNNDVFLRFQATPQYQALQLTTPVHAQKRKRSQTQTQTNSVAQHHHHRQQQQHRTPVPSNKLTPIDHSAFAVFDTPKNVTKSIITKTVSASDDGMDVDDDDDDDDDDDVGLVIIDPKIISAVQETQP